MTRERLVLALFITTRKGLRGVRLWRMVRVVNLRLGRLRVDTLADWEVELLTDRRWGRFFAW